MIAMHGMHPHPTGWFASVPTIYILTDPSTLCRCGEASTGHCAIFAEESVYQQIDTLLAKELAQNVACANGQWTVMPTVAMRCKVEMVKHRR